MGKKAFPLKLYVALSLSLLIILAFLYLLKPFVMVFLWAGILAFFLHPLYQKLNHLLRNKKTLASLLTLFLFIIFILTPSAILFLVLYSEVQAIIQKFDASLLDKAFSIFSNLQQKLIFSYFYPYLEPYLNNLKAQLPQHISNLVQYLLQSLGNIFLATFNTLLKIIFTLFALYYFLCDGEKILSIFKELIPAEEVAKERLLSRVSEILKAVLYGNILTAIIQGVLALAIYSALGIPQGVFFAFLTMLASFVPFGGTALVWLPLSLYLLFTGSYVKGSILLILCALTVAQIDNLVKPYLISGRTKIHNLLMFFAVLGGITQFGITGLFLGPLILGLFLSILEIYKGSEAVYNHSQENNFHANP